jgi:PAS domain S-box-containing protein
MTTGIEKTIKKEIPENSILHSLSVAIGTEVAGKIEFVNSSLCRLTGYKSSELKGKNLKFLFKDSTEFEHVEILREVFNSGSLSILTTLRKKDNEFIKVLCHFSILSTENNPPGIAFSIYDFSEGNIDLKTTHQQVELLGNIFRSIDDPFLIIRTKDYKVIKSSPTSTFGDAKDFSKCYSLTHGFDSPCNGTDHPCPMKEVVEMKKSVTVKHKHLNKEGYPTFKEIHAYPVLDENGDVTNIIEYFIEIKNNLAENKKTNGETELFKELYENATIGIYRSTPKGKIIIANPAAIAILGYVSLDELIEINLEEGYQNSDDRMRFQKIMEAEGTTFGFETRWKRADNKVIDISISAKSVKDDNNNIIYYEGIIENITEKKKAEREIIRAKEEAEEMNRLKSNFLANISHELRTPLSGMLGFTEILSEEINNSFQKEIVGNIYQSGLRLLRSLDSVMNFSKLESEKIELTRVNLNVPDAAINVVSWFKTEADRKNLELGVKIIEKNLTAELDENLFKQIISNLIENSIKYTAEGKILVVVDKEKKQDTDWVVIKVQDTGIGIHPENQKYIFDAFRQESEGLSRKYEGMGLGLTITKKYVELLDGEILVESNPGSGSCFTLKFPCYKKSESDLFSEQNLKENKIDENDSNLPKVLLVENEEASVQITKYFLKDLCSIDAVNNGKDALIMLMEKDYSAVIMDIDLAGVMDGIQATKEIRKIAKFTKLPIIALTAYAMRGDKEKILAAGCSYYMSKPFRREEINALLSSVLSSRLN